MKALVKLTLYKHTTNFDKTKVRYSVESPASSIQKKSEVSTWTHSFRQSAMAVFPVSFSGSSQRTEGCQAKLLAAVV